MIENNSLTDKTVNLRLSSLGLVLRATWGDGMDEHQGPLVSRCVELGSRTSGETFTIGRRSVYMKGGPLPKSASRRHRLRRVLLGAPLPALAEFQAAEWLRKRLFQTPEPLAAIEVYSRRGLGALGSGRIRRPVAQMFVSAAVPDVVTFQGAWVHQTEAERESVCHELGIEVGRMHALHFLHADLYPRNVLVDQTNTDGRALWFIDSWAGGATAWRRGSLRRLESDLGTWLTEFEPGLVGPYLRTLLEAYLEARFQNGRPIQAPGRWLAAVNEARRHELRRLERQRYRLRGARFPQAGLALPALGAKPNR